MSATHFSPWAEPQPCWHCRHFGGMLYDATAAARSAAGFPRVRSMPRYGCSAFERELSADDQPGPPAPVTDTRSLEDVCRPAVRLVPAVGPIHPTEPAG